MKKEKITTEAVKTLALELKETISDRGDMCRAIAAKLKTTYGHVYGKLRELAKTEGWDLSTRVGRKPNPNKAEKKVKAVAVALFDVLKAKDKSVVAKGVTQAVAEEMVAKAKKAKKGSLVIEKASEEAPVEKAEEAPKAESTEALL